MSRRFYVTGGLLVGLVGLVHVANLLIGPSSPGIAWTTHLAWVGMSGFAGLRCVWTACRQPERHLWRAWLWTAFGCWSWMSGAVIWAWNQLFAQQHVAFTPLADVFFVASPVLVSIGISQYRATQRAEPVTLKRLGDFCVVLFTASMVQMMVLYQPLAQRGSLDLHVGIALSYPGVNAACLMFGVLMYSQSQVSSRGRRVLLLLLAGVASQTFAATVLVRAILSPGFTSGSHAFDPLWLINFGLIAIAALEDAPPESSSLSTQKTLDLDVLVIVVAVGAVGLGLIAVSEDWTADNMSLIGTGLMGLGLSLGMRHHGTTLVERELRARMAEFNTHLEERVEERTRQLQSARDAAQQANLAKSRFLANMSHELRTPLSGILGYASLVSDELLDIDATVAQFPAAQVSANQIRTDVHNIEDAGTQLLGLIDHLLDIARMEAGEVTVNPGRVCIADVLADVRVVAQPLVESGGNTLTFQVDDDVPLITTDPERVRQIVLNLVGNAAKFTQNGAVTVRVSREDNRVAIAVVDTGVGISTADLKRVFEPFEQAGELNAVREGGTGLGLSISRSLTELLGGSLTGESVEGAGSKFTLFLPVAPRD